MKIDEWKIDDWNDEEKVTKKEKSKRLRDDSDVGIFLKKNYIFETDKIKKRTYQIITKVFEIRIPEKNEQIRIRTQRQINLISVLLLFVRKYKKLQEVTISTYTFNKEAISIIKQLCQNNKIIKLNLIIASSYNYRDVKHKEHIINEFKKLNVHLTFCNIHFKITLIKTKNEYFQIEGSMNYSTNNLAEQILIEQNKQIYFFDYELLNKIMREKNNNLEIIY